MTEPFRTPRVLVVDDEFLIRWSVGEALTEAGWHVTEAWDGSSALAALANATAPFDAVLLDYRLPDVTDLSLLQEVCKRTPSTRVVLMTAFSTPDVISGAIALGASQVVAKPFDVETVAAIIGAATATGRLRGGGPNRTGTGGSR